MTGLPQRTEAAPQYFTYIDRVSGEDIRAVLDEQLVTLGARLRSISEEKSLYRYAPEKWSIRQVWNHVNDTERAFLFRAMWFARGFTAPLPGYDQEIAAAGAGADNFSWAAHVEEFQAIRRDTLAFFRNLPDEAWMRRGIASDNPFTVRALAYIIAGHVSHHWSVIEDKYV